MTENFPAHDHAGRRSRARAALDAASLPALLVTNPVNVRWLTGFTGSNGSVLLTADRALLVTDARYRERVRAMDAQLEMLLTSSPIADVTAWATDSGLATLGLEAAHVSWADADAWRTVAGRASLSVEPTVDLVETLRAVKDDAELARIRRACEITVQVLDEVIADLKPGRTERDVREQLEDGFVHAGAEAIAFDSIIASGPNGAIPHHESGDRRISSGELVTLDCGARVDGYRSDCTRTVAVGPVDDRWRDIHHLVMRAQAAGRDAVEVGAGGRDVDRAARAVIEEAGHGDHFVHGTGHGVGLDIHEAPAIGARASSTLAAGMTVTVEPGIYLPGSGGVRIEDTLLVTADGNEVLTDGLPRDLQVV